MRDILFNVRRNPLITSVLNYSKDVESFGSVLRHITKACNEADVRFEFKMTKSGFVVIFYRRDESVDKSGDKIQKGADKLRIQFKNLSANEIIIVEYLCRNDFVTNGTDSKYCN